MNKINIAVKYKRSTSGNEIKTIEEKFKLKMVSKIPVLHIVSYKAEKVIIEELEKEDAVKYVEIEQRFSIAESDS
ncbi:MAG: hypothetical protein JW969_00435 [Spirochaetales bacterium]|nr:hypothetical protein [Spirochaetales bacterium]